MFLEGESTSVESFILSRPSASKSHLISAAFECLREHVPMNEAEILGRCRRGFRVVGRSERDGQGAPYPLLHMMSIVSARNNLSQYEEHLNKTKGTKQWQQNFHGVHS